MISISLLFIVARQPYLFAIARTTTGHGLAGSTLKPTFLVVFFDRQTRAPATSSMSPVRSCDSMDRIQNYIGSADLIGAGATFGLLLPLCDRITRYRRKREHSSVEPQVLSVGTDRYLSEIQGGLDTVI